jgi:hypothetical protein
MQQQQQQQVQVQTALLEAAWCSALVRCCMLSSTKVQGGN